MIIGRIPKNYVLVHIKNDVHDSVKLNDQEIYIDSSYEPEKHSVTNGIVETLPEVLHYNGVRSDENGLQFDTDMDLKKGDQVYFHYLETINAKSRGRIFDVEGKKYMMVRYDMIYFAKRDDDIIMVNGWVLVEPIEHETLKSDIIHIPNSIQENKQEGIVKHIGKPLRAYKMNPDVGEENDEVHEGDHILFTNFSNIPIEYKLHETMGKLFRMQRKDIIAKHVGV